MTYPNLKQSIWLLVLWLLITIGLGILLVIVGKIIITDEPLHEYDYVRDFCRWQILFSFSAMFRIGQIEHGKICCLSRL